MELEVKLRQDLKESMKSRKKLRVSTIRMLLSEIRNAEIEKGSNLDREELMTVVAREAKKRREAITEFTKADRPDLADKESLELEVLKEYLPEQLPEEELRRMIMETIEEVGATSPRDLGRVMGRIMPHVRGKADGEMVNRMVREMLEGD